MLLWIAYSMLCTVGFAGIAKCAEVVLVRPGVSRRWIWIGAMGASALLPCLASLLIHSAPAVGVPNSAIAEPSMVTGEPVAGLRVDEVVEVIWVTASLLIAAWLAAVQVTLRRRLRGCERVQISGATLLVSPTFGPAVVGAFRPYVVIPAWALSLNEPDRSIVLTHEFEHTRAKDPALHLVGLLLAVALPWNLALWWQLARLKLAIEIDCDARVIRGLAQDPAAYGQLLLDACAYSNARVHPRGALALAQHRSGLGRRVEAMMSSGGRSTLGISGAVMLGATLCAVLAFAPAPPLPRLHFGGGPVGGLPMSRSASPRSSGEASPVVRQSSVAIPLDSVTTVHRVARRTVPAEGVPVIGPLPPFQLARSGSDAELRAFSIPTPRRLPAGRARGGAGGFVGRAIAVPGAAAGPLQRPDTIRPGGVARLVRRDTSPPSE